MKKMYTQKASLNAVKVTTISTYNRSFFKWIMPGLLSLMLVMSTVDSIAQDTPTSGKDHNTEKNEAESSKTLSIKGVVSDDSGERLIGAHIGVKGTDRVAITNLDGEFELESALRIGDVIVISFIGQETQEYTITSLNQEVLALDVKMQPAVNSILGASSSDQVYSSKRNVWQKITGIFR